MLLHTERFKIQSSNAAQNARLYKHATMLPGSLHIWLSGNTAQSFIQCALKKTQITFSQPHKAQDKRT
jgi:hypothetical protein